MKWAGESWDVRWFGESWDAPLCEEVWQVDTPVGDMCMQCGVAIRAGDQGLILPSVNGDEKSVKVAWHLNCFLASLGVA